MADMRRGLAPDQVPLALAQCHEMLARMGRAEELYREALARKPKDALALGRAARFYLRTDQPEKAEPLLRSLLDPALPLPDGERAWVRRQLALALASGGDRRVDEALGLLESNRREGGETPDDRRIRALVLAARPGERQQALRTLEGLAGGPPPSAHEQFRLARLYEQEKDWTRARDQLLGALAQDGNNPVYLAHLIEGLLSRGKADEARAWVARLEKVEPDAPRTQAFRAQLPNPAKVTRGQKR
jgi:tetratricopeptide (TPR) repeat protein